MMENRTEDAPQEIRNPQSAIRNFVVLLFWLVVGLAVTLLAARFGLRLLGVRPDIPFPGFVYSVTAPVVTPFYRFFPVSERFDYYAVEWAALVAAGCVLMAALIIYGAGLVVYSLATGAGGKKVMREPRT